MWNLAESIKSRAASIHLARIIALAKPAPRDLILEVGSGTGHLAACLAAEGFNVVAVDKAMKPLRRSCGVTRVSALASLLPFCDLTFNLVVCCHSLEHVADIDAAVADIRRVLRRKARFIVIYPYEPLRGMTLAGNFNTWPEFWQYHRHKFIPRTLAQLMKKHRLTELATQPYLGFIPMYISCYEKR